MIRRGDAAQEKPRYEVAIIGAGPGGIAAAHLLRRRGICDIVILERGSDFGGSWRDNHYPGLTVDIPILWYQFSFARNPRWTRLFAPGSEIQGYLTETARDLGLYPLLRPHSEVVRQSWDEQAALWRLDIADGEQVSARFVVSSVGGYVNAKPNLDIPGLDEFEGTVLRPNAWDDSYDTRGKNVAVIGTGSSGVQIVSALSGTVSQLDVYQRTPNWILPKVDFGIPPLLRALLRLPGIASAGHLLGRAAFDLFFLVPVVHLLSRIPDRPLTGAMRGYDAFIRLMYRGLLRRAVRDEATRDALLPRHGILAKRPVISSSYLTSFNEPATHLITTPIARVTATGVRTVDGVERPADLIVTATGYELWTDPETYRVGTILGTDGFDLAQYYRTHGLRSYAGTAHPRLPNRWEIVGPLGFVGVGWTDFVETIAEHAVRVIDAARRRDCEIVAVTPRAFQAWDARMRRAGRVAHLYFTRCNPESNTYFVNSRGETVYHRPQTITAARRFARHSALEDYLFTTAHAPEPAAEAEAS
ncbi:flavin-containing monooxygenase [Nocardia barduliensis]|uniref:flavin-containing monooxygenase n=1 Tax=Nocardia barduliensis TaxID=2736643 RepID=UPI0028AB73CF|nr:NAD(P)/FAD-dependent oxidoreductase [Nocardia barduliensis]